MIKTFKFRLYPTKSQKRILDFSFDESRLVYNSLLCVRKEQWEVYKKSFGKYDCNKLMTTWKETRPRLYDIHSQVLQQISDRLDKAFKAFFRRVKSGEKVGYPRFKKDSFCSLNYSQSGFEYKEGKLKLSKIGSVKIKVTRYFPEQIKNCIIKKSKTGKYHACLVCEVDKNTLPKTNRILAFDLGIKNFLVTSENEIVDNPKYLNKSLNKLQNIQRQYSKSKSRKHLKRLRLIYEKITNQREDFLHKLSANIVKVNDIIILEDLDIKNMMSENKSLNRNISDVSWNSFIEKLVYKAENAGRLIIKANPANTSNTCSQCGVKHRIDLSTRKLPCCDIDRDLNAAINIKALGMQSLAIMA